MRYAVAALATALVLLVGCEDHRARPPETAIVTAQPTVTPATVIAANLAATPAATSASTPKPIARSRTVTTPDGPLQAWVDPPPTGVVVIDAAIADIMRGDAADIARRITGGLYPCSERAFGLGQQVVCPAGVVRGTPVPALLVGGGCEWDWVNLEQYRAETAEKLAARDLLLVTAFREDQPHQWGSTHGLIFVDSSRPADAIFVELDGQGILGTRGNTWGPISGCTARVALIYSYPGVEYLIPRAP